MYHIIIFLFNKPLIPIIIFTIVNRPATDHASNISFSLFGPYFSTTSKQKGIHNHNFKSCEKPTNTTIFSMFWSAKYASLPLLLVP